MQTEARFASSVSLMPELSAKTKVSLQPRKINTNQTFHMKFLIWSKIHIHVELQLMAFFQFSPFRLMHCDYGDSWRVTQVH